MSLVNEQWIKNLSELCLDPNGNYHKFRKPQGAGGLLEPAADRFKREVQAEVVVLFAERIE